jgi:hypothetical protein
MWDCCLYRIESGGVWVRLSERYLGIRFNKRIGIKGLKECGFVVTVEKDEGS